MKILKLIFILFTLTFSFAFGQDSISNASKVQQKEQIEIKFPEKIIVENPKTETLESDKLIQQIPWIIALLVGILTLVANIYLSKQLRKTSENNLINQLNHNKEITLIQLKGTIATQNRQEWINNLRQNISELITSAVFIIADYENKNDPARNIEKLVLSKSKIELLINPDNEDHNDLVNKIESLLNEISKGEDDYNEDRTNKKRVAVIEISRKIFQKTWAKIKRLE